MLFVNFRQLVKQSLSTKVAGNYHSVGTNKNVGRNGIDAISWRGCTLPTFKVGDVVTFKDEVDNGFLPCTALLDEEN